MSLRNAGRLALSVVMSALFAIAGPPSHSAEPELVWQFSETGDAATGRTEARLAYGVPETDGVQVTGVCEAEPRSDTASLTFAADVGTLGNGQPAELRFSGGGFEQVVKGSVRRSEGEGITGVALSVKHADPLWAALTEGNSLDYLVPGYLASKLQLEKTRGEIARFIEACRRYAAAAPAGGDGKDATTASAEQAFNSAKELGTVDAWNAFLGSYPTGFHADLARAYLKKLTSAPDTAAAPSPAPRAVAAARELACSEERKIRSLNSDVPAKVTFVNTSSTYRALHWIDESGNSKDYGGLNAGEKMTIDTFVTHPWVVTTGPGDCLQIFLPVAGATTIELAGLPADKGPPPKTDRADPPPAKKKSPPLKCAKNYQLKGGECVLVQNCGKNAFRNAEGDCDCKKNYTMRNGRCVWKTDKNGFEVKPWEKPGCNTWQKQCGQGNASACTNYEENCQVN
jgi:hypothetical protein